MTPKEKCSHSINYLLVIGSPDTTGDLAFQVDLRGPVSLPADRSHQDKPITVRDESLSAIVGPGEVTHLKRNRRHEWKSMPFSMFAFHTHIFAVYHVCKIYDPSNTNTVSLTCAPRSFTSSTDQRPSYWIQTNIPPSVSQVANFWKGSFHRTKTT